LKKAKVKIQALDPGVEIGFCRRRLDMLNTEGVPHGGPKM